MWTPQEIGLAINPDVWAEHVSEGAFKPFLYQRQMMRAVAEAVRAGGGRVIINVPSRHGKSTAISKWMPLWFLNHYPTKNVIIGTYGQQLSNDWSREVRNEFLVNANLKTKLSEDSQAVNAWRTEQGGALYAAGVDGPLLGRGFHLGIVDDPHKDWESAHSFVEREKTIRWFGTTFFSRQNPGAVIVIIQQRMHDEDLSGWLISQQPGRWKIFSFPAFAGKNDPLGRAEGDVLCPELYSRQTLLDIRSGGLSEAWWEAMYQQNPQAIGGGKLYEEFDKAVHVDPTIELRPGLPLQVSFDFNRNPGMHVEVSQYDTIKDSINVSHEIHGPYMKLQASLDRLGELIRDTGGWRYPQMEIFGDATGTQERAETTLTCYQMILEWAKKTGWPYRLRVPPTNPPIRNRIDTVNAALRDPDGDIHMKIHPRCTRLIVDLKEMRPDEQGLEDKRDAKLSHASSAIGYLICWVRPIRRMQPVAAVPVMMGAN